MTKQRFRQLVQSKILVLDGSTGVYLQNKGMPSGACPEQWMLEHKDVLVKLQEAYVSSGSDVLYAPTFTANRIKLKEYGLENEISHINHELVRISKRMAIESDRRIYVAGDMTMTGESLYPAGTLRFEQLIDVYKEQASHLLDAGVDMFVVETMMSLQECRAALIAVKETCDLPLMVTMTFEKDGRTLYGTDPKTALITLQGMGADAVGINCSVGPEGMLEMIREMKRYATVPLIAKPNAGMPYLKDGKAHFDLEPKEFTKQMEELVEAGAGIVGGCCGTGPEHIRHLKETCGGVKPTKLNVKSICAVTSERMTVEISKDAGLTIVGERINPTGKKDLQGELREGRWDLTLKMAEEQVENGAAILDVNMGMNGIDEKERMLEAVMELTKTVSVPLCIDTSHVDVMEEALRVYPGRALINSISLEKEKMERMLLVAKKYGAMFILLPLSDKGLPENMKEKKEIIQTIIGEAQKHGMSKEDIMVDALVTTVGANRLAALEALETIRYCKKEQGVATICGLSNISFGLPERQTINAAFLTMAIKEGLSTVIANPSQNLLVNVAFATDLLLNKEGAGERYLNRVNEGNPAIDKPEEEKETSASYEAIVKGNKQGALEAVQKELSQGKKASEIIEGRLIPAINKVGELFDKQVYFLPQLISSAEAMKVAMEHLEPLLQADAEKGDGKTLPTVVLATVDGDIHDIGKNLVALMLKNYGYRVLDLGKNVPSEKIVRTAKEKGASVIGLSALMTTTMQEMGNVVRLAKEMGVTAKIIVGGAVVTDAYAKEIGADGYSKDARDAVLLVNKLTSRSES